MVPNSLPPAHHHHHHVQHLTSTLAIYEQDKTFSFFFCCCCCRLWQQKLSDCSDRDRRPARAALSNAPPENTRDRSVAASRVRVSGPFQSASAQARSSRLRARFWHFFLVSIVTIHVRKTDGGNTHAAAGSPLPSSRCKGSILFYHGLLI